MTILRVAVDMINGCFHFDFSLLLWLELPFLLFAFATSGTSGSMPIGSI
jgi:hypothetical protein